MRRGLASFIMGLSLLVATGSWAGFIMSRTVLDPGRSERLADNLLDNEDVRSAIVDRLSDAVEAQIPAEVPVRREVIEQGADAALDDPRVEALLRDGLVRTHQNALNGVDEPVTLDASALGAAGRDAVVQIQPELDAVLPASPELEVELPSTGLSWLGTVKRWVDRLTLIGAVVALVGVTTAFILARNRAAALRRIAFWAFGASAFWLAVAYGLPWVLERVAPSSVSIASAAIDVFFGAMIRPALTLAGIGVVLLLMSFVWPAIERRRPAAQLDRAAGGRQRRGAVPAPTQSPRYPEPATSAAHGGATTGAAYGGDPYGQPAPVRSSSADPTTAYAVASPTADAGYGSDRYTQPSRDAGASHNARYLADTYADPAAEHGHGGAYRADPYGDPGAEHEAATTRYAQPGAEHAPADAGRYGADPYAEHEAATARSADPYADPDGGGAGRYGDPYSEHEAATARSADPYAEPSGGGADRYSDPYAEHEAATARFGGDRPVPPQPPTQVHGGEPAHVRTFESRPPSVYEEPNPARPVTSEFPVIRTNPEVPAFDVDPEAAADADDFGANWVEGVGYVDDESSRT